MNISMLMMKDVHTLLAILTREQSQVELMVKVQDKRE